MTLDQYNELQAEWLATGEIEPFGAGLSKYWHTGYKDPFLIPALIHDMDYTFKEIPKAESDYLFYQRCSNIAGSNLWLKSKARFYYIVVVTIGAIL